MRRTQLYLDDSLWTILHDRARQTKTTVSALVREAVRDRYLGNLDKRKAAMLAFIGSREDRTDLPDTETYIRSLRRGTRLERLYGK